MPTGWPTLKAKIGHPGGLPAPGCLTPLCQAPRRIITRSVKARRTSSNRAPAVSDILTIPLATPQPARKWQELDNNAQGILLVVRWWTGVAALVPTSTPGLMEDRANCASQASYRQLAGTASASPIRWWKPEAHTRWWTSRMRRSALQPMAPGMMASPSGRFVRRSGVQGQGTTVRLYGPSCQGIRRGES